jgi:phosphate:Na+ symporter
LNILKFSGDLTTALALFHTIFNLLGVITLFFFINKLADYLKGFFQYKQEHATKFIHLTDPSIAETALVALKNEANHLFIKCLKYTLLCVNVKANDLFKAEVNIKEVLSSNDVLIEFDHKKNYEQIKSIESDIFEFVQKLNALPLTPQESNGIDSILNSVRATAYVAKLTKDIRNNAIEFSESESTHVHELFNQMRLNLLKCFRLYIDLSEKRIDETTLNTGFEEVLETNRKHLKEIASSFSSRDVKNALLISLSNTNRSFFIIYSSLREASAITTLQFDIENKQTSNEKEI